MTAESKYIKIIVIITLEMFLLSGLWAIDIGSSALCWEQQIEATGIAKGLAFARSPNIQYHIGLLLVYIVFFIMSAMVIYELIIKRDDKQNATTETLCKVQ